MTCGSESKPAPPECPSSQELAAFDTGRLSEDRTDEITVHIQSCETCQVIYLPPDDDSASVRQALVDEMPPVEDVAHFLREPEYVELRQNLLAFPEPVPEDLLPDDMESTWAQLPLLPALPYRLGSYELLEQVGQGAMGAVYRARHVSLKREVAVKVLAPGRLSKSHALARFRREMEAIGRLNHAHIITAHDAGEVEGCHFLVTEFVEGLDLSTLVRRLGPLPLAETCELVRQAALGLEAAHGRAMVHQDVKPSNLMVTPEGQVKVLDLGLVSFLSETTEQELADEVQMGTPDYMAPERWKNRRHVDIRADVYSLGCTLFKLLAGFAPFSQPLQAVEDKAQGHLWDAVPSLRKQRHDIPANLERAVYRMLAKSPDDRFATPAAVAEVLEPFAKTARLKELVNRAQSATSAPAQPVPAKPQGSPALRPPRWRVGATMATAAVAAAVLLGVVIYAVTNVGTVVVTVYEDDVKVTLDEGQIDITSPRDTIRVSAGSHLLKVEKDGFQTFSQRFVVQRGGKQEFEVALVPERATTESSSVEPRPKIAIRQPPLSDTMTQLAHLLGHTDSVPCVAISPDGKRILSASVDKTIRMWDTATGAELRRFTGHTDKVVCVVFSPDASRFASASHDGTVRIWNAQTGDENLRLQGHRGWVNRVDFSPDGRWLVSGGEDGVVRVWESTTGGLKKSLVGHTSWIRSVAFVPDGRQVISAGNDATAILWDLEHERMKRVYQGHNHVVTHAVVSSSGRYTLSGSLDHRAVLWDYATAQPLRILSGHDDTVFAVAFLHDAPYAITASADHTLALWDLATGRKLSTFAGHTDYALSIAISPDGRFFASSGQDKTIRLWPIPQLPQTKTTPIKSDRIAGPSSAVQLQTSTEKTWKAHDGAVGGVAWTSDGRYAVSGGEDNMVRCWSIQDASLRWSAKHEGDVTSIAVSFDGTLTAAGDKTGSIVLRDLDLGHSRGQLAGHTAWVTGLAFSEDDGRLASGSFDKTLRIWDVRSGQQTLQSDAYAAWVRAVALDRRAERLWCAGNQTVVLRTDFSGRGDRLYGKPGTGHVLATLSLSPDERLVAAAGWNQSIRLWNRQDGQELKSCDGHLAAITQIDFAPDGQHIVSASMDQSVRMWDVATKNEVCRFLGHQGPVSAVAVSPDGRLILSGSTDGTLRVWRVGS